MRRLGVCKCPTWLAWRVREKLHIEHNAGKQLIRGCISLHPRE
jgi:hypothetical protein